ncbi:MAG: hypothetical protein RMJ67_05700 [Elusimicrobiota bacterium]|nr:hypothetical protein [Endomicrobiia bacterium]MDW8165985.1 hypothetical protein [Elusimicrobiota bacterium]
MKARDLIDFLDLQKEYEEFKSVMDDFILRLRRLNFDEDVFVYKLRKYFERERKIILLLFLEEWERDLE